jgi:hypothetical protein
VRLAGAAALLLLVACAPIASTPQVAPQASDRAFSIARANAPSLLASGEGRLVSITLRNTGDVPWQADGRLTYTWTGAGEPVDGEVTPLPSEVDPGDSVDVVIPLVAPLATGAYTLTWRLSDSAGSFAGRGDAVSAPVEVRAPEARITWSDLLPPEHVYADVATSLTATVANAGTVAWPAKSAGSVVLSYHWRDAGGRLTVWDGERTALGAALDPGESGSKALRIVPPSAPGRYILELDAVREGLGWFGGGPRLTVDVGAPSYTATLSLVQAPSRVTVGQPVDIALSLKNTGKAPLPDAGPRRTRIAYHITDAQSRIVLWDGPRTEVGKPVGPGESVAVAAVARAPERPGVYKLTFEPVQEGVTWFTQRGSPYLDVFIEVVAVDFKAYFGTTDAPKTMAAGLTYTVRPTIVNVGVATWPRAGFDPVRLGAHWLDDRGRAISWDDARIELPKDVAPRDSINAELDVTAPDRPGTYTLVLDLVQEHVDWFADRGTLPAKLTITVAPPTFRASWSGDLPTTLRAGEIASAMLTVRNDGPFAWTIGGDHPVRVAHHWRELDGDLVVWDGFRSELPRELQPGESATIPVWLFAPGRPGTYVLEIDVVQEDVTWFAQKGSSLLRATVEVAP